MRYIALVGCILIVTLTTLLVLKTSNPQLYLKLSLTFYFINPSPDAKQEKKRLDHIELLPISDEKKNILTNRTIFLGASSSMVRLALGDPIDGTYYEDGSAQYWTYHFEEDLKPTILEFHNNELLSAYSSGNRPR